VPLSVTAYFTTYTENLTQSKHQNSNKIIKKEIEFLAPNEEVLTPTPPQTNLVLPV
jgi:hypothetical protein